jgi:hypothetical protein
MASTLTESQVEFIGAYFSDSDLLGQVAAGGITAEDASRVFDIREDEGQFTVTDTVSGIGDITTNIQALLDEYLNGLGGSVNTYTNDLYAGVFADYYSTLEFMSETSDRIEALLANDIGQDLGRIDDTLSAMQQAVLGLPLAQVQSMENLGEELGGNIFSWIADQSDTIFGVLGRETEELLGELSGPLGDIQSITEEIVTKTTDFASALRETIPEIGQVVGEAVEGVGDAVTSGFTMALGGVVDLLGLGFIKPLFEQLQNLEIDQVSEIFGSPPREDLVGPGMYRHLSTSWPSHLSSVIPFVGNLMNMVFAGQFDITRQLSAGWFKSSLLSANELAVSEKRQDTTHSDNEYIWNRLGLDDYQQLMLSRLTNQLPDIGTLVRWESRGIIEPQDFPTLAGRVGWAPEVAEQYKAEYYGPPPVGDLIRMAVREVFSPEIAESFGQYDEIPAEYMEWAEKIGLTQEWATNYWAAHWTLPSMQMGFEMLHREVITPDQLDNLFVAQDVMPFWREALKQISYRVVTRVDVRRFHALGIYDEAQVLDAYMKMGFNETNAGEMTQFTLAYNDSTKKGEKARERDLSKSDIIGMYNDGVLDADTTRTYLIQLGYDDAEATVLIEREDIQELRRERKADISNIIDQAKIKALTYEEAQDRLAALDLTRTETNKALADLARVSQTRTRTPSKSDLDDWLAMNLITEGDYAEELRTLGFADRYVALYVEATSAEAESDLLAEESKAAGRREPRAVSKGNLDSLYQAEIISLTGYTDGLQTLGYREADITNLLEQQTLKLEERQRDEAERLARGEDAALRERLPSRSLLGKLFLKGLIGIESYEEGLTLLGFSPENIELLSKLIGAKAEEDASEPAGVNQ